MKLSRPYELVRLINKAFGKRAQWEQAADRLVTMTDPLQRVEVKLHAKKYRFETVRLLQTGSAEEIAEATRLACNAALDETDEFWNRTTADLDKE